MANDLSVEDRQAVLEFISALENLDIPWFLNDIGRIRTKKFSYNGRPCCPLEARHAEEKGWVIGFGFAKVHYGLSTPAWSAIVYTADGDKDSEFRELMFVATNLEKEQ